MEYLEVSKLKGYDLAINMKKIDQNSIEKLSDNPNIEKTDIINGYLNIRLKPEYYVKLKFDLDKEDRVIAIEYPSVNPNKPWHIGHLRNAVIGESMYRIFNLKYNNVKRIDYIDDLGLQVAQSYWYYKKYGLTSEHEKFDHKVGMDYAKANQIFQEYENEIRDVLRRMEEENVARDFVDKVLKSQLETAKLYGVQADYRIYESDIKRDIFEIGLKKLKDQGYIEYVYEGELAGTYVTKFGRKVIIRSDGTATYLGKDIVFQMWKAGIIEGLRFVKKDNVWYSSDKGEIKNINANTIINVIGIEQSSHQNEIKEIFKYISSETNYLHLVYQRVRLKEGHFSGRSGNWLGYTADDLYREALYKTNNHDLALASIKFFILKHNPKTEVMFDWDKALSTSGGSGVYILYSYVRMLGLERNATVQPNLEKLDDDDRELLKYLLMYKSSVDKAIRYLDPSVIAELILDLAESFNSYYSKHRISNNPSKLWIVKKIRSLYEKILDCLTIPIVTKI